MIVFKPEVNSVLQGKVIGQNERGLFVQVGMSTVYIPADRLMKPYF